MDYKELLKKYISHVAFQEGVDFLSDFYYTTDFTEEEWEELNSLDFGG